MTWVWFFFSIRLSDHPPYLYVAKHFHWEVKSNHKQKCLDSNHWNCQSINWYFIRSDFKINAMGWRYTCTTLLLRGSRFLNHWTNMKWFMGKTNYKKFWYTNTCKKHCAKRFLLQFIISIKYILFSYRWKIVFIFYGPYWIWLKYNIFSKVYM